MRERKCAKTEVRRAVCELSRGDVFTFWDTEENSGAYMMGDSYYMSLSNGQMLPRAPYAQLQVRVWPNAYYCLEDDEA